MKQKFNFRLDLKCEFLEKLLACDVITKLSNDVLSKHFFLLPYLRVDTTAWRSSSSIVVYYLFTRRKSPNWVVVYVTSFCNHKRIFCFPFSQGFNSWMIRYDVYIDGRALTHTHTHTHTCLLYTSPSPRDRQKSRMPSSA